MCDTFVILPGSTAGQKTFFAKNSDRSPNEANLVINQPAQKHDLSVQPNVALTYISIPQAAETLGFVMVKPCWTWGCEMGVNQAGVAVGNEAVFTKGAYGGDALLGMDICRLVLERCRTAEEGARLIGNLLETHGQGGNCGYDSDFRYDNSYLVADAGSAYVVETAGKYWVAKQVEDLYAISNDLTVRNDWTFGSAALSGKKERVDFAAKFSRKFYANFSGAALRRFSVYSSLLDDRDGREERTIMTALLGSGHAKRAKARGISYETCRRTLRMHPPDMRKPVEAPCMHYGGMFGDHTTGSMICSLKEKQIALTGGSTPCKTIFKRFSLTGELPFGSDPDEAERYWARRELIQRNLLGGALPEKEYLQTAGDAEQEIDRLADGFSESGATGLNRMIYDIENAVVTDFFSRCSRKLEDISPKKGSALFKSRWGKKNEVFLRRLAELNI